MSARALTGPVPAGVAALVAALVAGAGLLAPAMALAGVPEPATSAVLVVDTSGSMAGSRLAGARAALEKFVAAVPDGVRLGLVTFDDTAREALPVGSARRAIVESLGSLRGSGGTALYDAVDVGSRLCLVEQACRVVVFSDGADTASGLTLAQASRLLAQRGIATDVVAFRPSAQQRADLRRLAASSGGTVASAADIAELTPAFIAAAQRLPLPSPTVQPEPPSSAAAPASAATSAVATVAASPGVSVPSASARPSQAPVASATNTTAIALGIAAGIAVLALAAALLSARRHEVRVRRIRQVLAYQSRPARPGADPGARDAGSWARCDAYLARHLGTQGIADRCIAAGLSLTPARWLAIRLTCALLAVSLLWLLTGSWAAGLLVGGTFGWVLPGAWLRSRANRRRRAFGDALPDFLMVLASSLRAGLSFAHALESTAEEGSGEVERQMRRVLREVQVGATLDVALLECAHRMDNDDLRWTVTALAIQREVGGNLSVILDTAARTIKARHEIAREVRTLSAEGRLSAYVLLALPLGVLGFLLIFRRSYIELLWTTSLGIALLIALAGALTTGWFWMRSIVRVRV